MSLPSSSEFAALNALAFEIREIFASRAYNIDVALDRDPAFRKGEEPRSGLIRALFLDAAKGAEIKTGHFSLEPGAGGATSVHSFDGGTAERWYRIRKAKIRDDEIIIESRDTVLEPEGDSLFHEERWVFAFTIDGNNILGDIFVAEIFGVTAGSPGHLILGDVHYLGVGATTPPPGSGRFDPTHEDLDLSDDDEMGEASEAS